MISFHVRTNSISGANPASPLSTPLERSRLLPMYFWGLSCKHPPRLLRETERTVVTCRYERMIHFALFVMACIATRKWRHEAKQARTGRRNIELQYHRSPEEHTAKQPVVYPTGNSDKNIEANNRAARHSADSNSIDKDIEANNGVGLKIYS